MMVELALERYLVMDLPERAQVLYLMIYILDKVLGSALQTGEYLS